MDMIMTDTELSQKKSEEKKNGISPSSPADIAVDERRLSLYKGLLPIFSIEQVVETLKKIPEAERENTFVFCDMNYLFRAADMVRPLGFPGLLPTQADREMESDRQAAKDFVKTYYPDLKVAETQEYKQIQEAIDFLTTTQECWVLKGNDPDAKTVVPTSDNPSNCAKELTEALSKHKDKYESAGFILERKICNALEITPQIVFWDGKPVYTDVDIELKKKGAGNFGPVTGCAANLVFPTELKDTINDYAFPPKIYQLATLHKGQFIFDASILIDPQTGDRYFGEYCANRQGWDATQTEIELAGGVKNYFGSIMNGLNPFDSITAQAGVAIRIFSPHQDDEFPKTPKAGVEMFIAPSIEDHTWMLDATMNDEGCMTTAGYMEDVAVITAAAETYEQAIDQVYSYLDSFSFDSFEVRPKFDMLSREYPDSIPNRYLYGKWSMYMVDIGCAFSMTVDPIVDRQFDMERQKMKAEFSDKVVLMQREYDLRLRQQMDMVRKQVQEIIDNGKA
ncbi:unnamed protein product [Sphagnum balticum]